MNKPRIKEIIEEIEDFLKIESKDFQYILEMYCEYLKLLSKNDGFKFCINDECVKLFSSNLWIVEKNIKGEMTLDEMRIEKVRLINLKENSEANCARLIKLLLTGLATKEGMLDYSNYEEYLASDMLEISFASLRDVDIKCAENFLLFCRNYK
ncbi:hypothetical protein [Delftia sp. UME58]|uniref:hypothetical protein n=1 Tax=Delftia sp. UME58 TaxID=1862322 RepID=UPI00160126D6|nr:hypothetical protein [Delftia sp. UME58]